MTLLWYEDDLLVDRREGRGSIFEEDEDESITNSALL